MGYLVLFFGLFLCSIEMKTMRTYLVMPFWKTVLKNIFKKFVFWEGKKDVSSILVSVSKIYLYTFKKKSFETETERKKKKKTIPNYPYNLKIPKFYTALEIIHINFHHQNDSLWIAVKF